MQIQEASVTDAISASASAATVAAAAAAAAAPAVGGTTPITSARGEGRGGG